MGITFTEPSGFAVGTANTDYFLTEQGDVTTNAEEAHQLLVRAGQPIPKEMADKYGIGKVAQQNEADSSPDAVDEKAKKAHSNKAEKPSADKKGVK